MYIYIYQSLAIVTHRVGVLQNYWTKLPYTTLPSYILCHIIIHTMSHHHSKTTGLNCLTPHYTPKQGSCAARRPSCRSKALILKSPLYVPLCSKCGRALTFQNVA